VVYGVLGYTVIDYAIGAGGSQSSDQQSVDLTAALMRHPGGRVLVVVIGLALVGAGLFLAFQAWRQRFKKNLMLGEIGHRTRQVVEWLGRIGGIARGAVFMTAGVFLVVAAVDAQPGQAKGIDSSLRQLAATPGGPWLLALVAAGLVMFGLYSCCEARGGGCSHRARRRGAERASLAGRLARAGPLQQGGEVTSKPHSFCGHRGEPGRQVVALAGDLGQPLLKLDDPADGRHRHALVRHRRDLLDDADLHAGIAALAAGRALRRDDLELVDAAQERLLEREHVRDLAHGVKRDILVVKRLHVPHLPAKW